ncbi:MEKHLA domain-containing protein [Mariprofundus ferrinatatus]|uniref:MEKHLA domain-containing protein n=1 Tax=Mariprofundus ferrinatatus TaxID=1921087 RepID=A0A2K8L6N4_9PROT|nr:MEKHLA domain-containing protein [Mariprofundus ferrinatatus]ATX82978.1 MEKHLA domain-containing protein [Mariprofundus ferrinatatus]
MKQCTDPPSETNDYQLEQLRLLSDSLKRWSGCGLLDDDSDPAVAARRVYFAPYALLSHGTGEDPVINYANHTAQQLFEMDWHEFTQLPSRLSAEAGVQAERNALLKRVTENGYIDDYSGVRIASSGRRFRIQDATVWNLIDKGGNYRGQAAMFTLWHYLG